MARQYKKILKKIKPKEKPEAKKPKERSMSDYILIAVLALTAVVMVIGWREFSDLNRGLYMTLTLTLAATFVRRNYNLTETQDLWLERFGYATMAIATVLFGFHVYYSYMN